MANFFNYKGGGGGTGLCYNLFWLCEADSIKHNGQAENDLFHV